MTVGPLSSIRLASAALPRVMSPADVGCGAGSWAAVAAQCNKTSGACPACAMNSSIASAVDEPRSKRFYYSNRCVKNER